MHIEFIYIRVVKFNTQICKVNAFLLDCHMEYFVAKM